MKDGVTLQRHLYWLGANLKTALIHSTKDPMAQWTLYIPARLCLIAFKHTPYISICKGHYGLHSSLLDRGCYFLNMWFCIMWFSLSLWRTQGIIHLFLNSILQFCKVYLFLQSTFHFCKAYIISTIYPQSIKSFPQGIFHLGKIHFSLQGIFSSTKQMHMHMAKSDICYDQSFAAERIQNTGDLLI